MTDPDFWKKQYADTWEMAQSKEEAIKTIVSQAAGCQVEYYGLGAGSQDFLSGNAQEHGHDKGDPDLHVQDTNIFIEVTGPNVPVDDKAPLWVRPDKLNNAFKRRRTHETWVVHCQCDSSLIRAIHLNDDFFAAKADFDREEVWIKGNLEKYISIPANHACVWPLQALIDYIRLHQ